MYHQAQLRLLQFWNQTGPHILGIRSTLQVCALSTPVSVGTHGDREALGVLLYHFPLYPLYNRASHQTQSQVSTQKAPGSLLSLSHHSTRVTSNMRSWSKDSGTLNSGFQACAASFWIYPSPQSQDWFFKAGFSIRAQAGLKFSTQKKDNLEFLSLLSYLPSAR